jgi:serine/threonine-protein kinase
MPSVAPDEADELIGSLVDGRYKILEAMASGSMGAVYKAERVPVGKVVAIKFLHAAFATEAEFLARFERETRVMSKLAHPNCVSVVDFGVFDGSPYIVMDYVAGTTLRSVIDLGPLDPPRALVLGRQIAAGLAHAHAQGVTHRDVKPANIMISEEIGTGEHVRILDFGLARLRGAVGRDATQSNVVVGTPNYMAPEQTVGGGTIDARTDVYAVGIVLFEMVAGERPFQAEDTLALLGMHRAAPIPKLADRVGRKVQLPEGLQQVIEKAMAKSPEDRYQSAIELAEAIDGLTGARSEPRITSTRRRTDPAAMAPTMQVDVVTSRTDLERPAKRGSNTLMGVMLVLLLLGGGAYAAWYLQGKSASKRLAAGSSSRAAGATLDAGTKQPAVDASGTPVVAVVDAAQPVPATVVDAATAPLLSIDAAEAPIVNDPVVDDPSEDDPEGPGSAGDEIDMAPDPTAAEDLSPKKPEDTHEDEADDAPKTKADVEKRAPAPVLATTIHDAVNLIKAGKTELALASLRGLAKKNPRSAYVPFLLGNLYFDKRWWSVAMDHYRIAIRKNAGYKRNTTLNRNVIRMLVSKKTSGQAEYFLRKTIGRPSVPYLRYAASHESSAYVRRYAAALAKAIGGR